jgi:hypothetical protein
MERRRQPAAPEMRAALANAKVGDDVCNHEHTVYGLGQFTNAQAVWIKTPG